MSTPRLKTWIWVQAQVAICNQLAIPIAIARKGNREAGAILLKLNRLDDGCEVLSQVRTAEGALVWFRASGEAPVTEAAADGLIHREMSFDPDLWVIEIEDPKRQYPMDADTL